jgi:hypothetical protein
VEAAEADNKLAGNGPDESATSEEKKGTS